MGHDWGARASYTIAAMYPKRLNALIVSPAGYGTGRPQQRMSVDQVRAYWYQWFFCTERGRDALRADAAGFCRELWRTWSPGWNFPDAEFEATAQSFDNPDFVDIVMHSYRYRWGYEKPDPKYDDAESFMRGLPAISTPTDSYARRGGRGIAARELGGQGAAFHRRVPKDSGGRGRALRPAREAGGLRLRHSGNCENEPVKMDEKSVSYICYVNGEYVP